MKYNINGRGFSNKAEIRTWYRSIFESYKRGEELTYMDFLDVHELLKFHPEYEEKTELGIEGIKVDVKEHEGYYTNNAFWIKHTNGTWTSFSYPTCLNNIPVPNKKELV